MCWNYRGAGSKEFELEMKNLLREHKPIVLILLEPWVSGEKADRICRKLRKNRWVCSEASGFSGGVWVLWDEEEAEIKLLAVRRSFLHL